MEATNKLEHFKWLLEQYAIRTVLHEQKRQTALAMMQTEGQNQPTANRAVLYALDDQRRAFDNLVEHYEREKAMEETKEVPGQTQEEAEKIIARQQPAYAIGSTLAVGTIRADKPSTKALEKIIKRQEKRIEDLARKNGNLECVVTSYEPFHNRLLAATDSKGLSEAVAVAEHALSEYMRTNKKN